MFRVGVDGSPHIKKIRKENQLESAGGRVFSLNKSPLSLFTSFAIFRLILAVTWLKEGTWNSSLAPNRKHLRMRLNLSGRREAVASTFIQMYRSVFL